MRARDLVGSPSAPRLVRGGRGARPRLSRLAGALALAAALAGAAGGCRSNPDPRSPSTAQMQKQSIGAWLVARMRHGQTISGELIAVEREVVLVLSWAERPEQRALLALPVVDITQAELFRYVSAASNLGLWGLGGTLSTVSHGVLLLLSAPIWAGVSSIMAAYESRHMIVEYPEQPLAAMANWARFPQGMPPGVDARALVTPPSVPAPRPAPPAPPSPVAPPVAPPAVEPARSSPAGMPAPAAPTPPAPQR
jgi:hypothetical protein